MRSTFRPFLAVLLTCLSFTAIAQQPVGTGTLVFDVKPFRSEVELKPKIENQLKSGGIEWGLKDGQMVVTMVNKRFVNFDINHMTRFGQQETLQLPPGEYKITGIGLEMVTAFSPEKVLAKGGYLNLDVASFKIEEGKTTTVSIDPVIRKDMTFLMKWFVPTLLTTISTDAGSSEPVALNARQAGTVAWRDYNGPLKFVAE
jgi:hypothetical protein